MNFQKGIEYGEKDDVSVRSLTLTLNHVQLLSPVPVTLNPNTGSELLTISEMMTRSSTANKSQKLPRNPERTDAVLGYQGFKSGKHSWDVEVEGFWALGVAEESSDRLNVKNVWGIYICTCHVWMHEIKSDDVVCKDSFPKRVRVQLDYREGTLSFLDLDKRTVVHTMKCTFKETVFPYFEEGVKILPSKLPSSVVP